MNGNVDTTATDRWQMEEVLKRPSPDRNNNDRQIADGKEVINSLARRS